MKFHQLRLKDVSYSNTQLKQEEGQIRSEIGNLSTSRAKGAVIKQFITEDNDTGRSCNNEKDLFRKMQNLEFQNGLFQMQMQHIHKRKNLEDYTIRQQLTQIQQDIQSIQHRVQSVNVNNDKMIVKNKSSRKKIKLSSSSSSSEDLSALSRGFNYRNNQDQMLQNYKELFEVCNGHEKLSGLFQNYCGTIKTIEIDIVHQNFQLLIQQLIKMMIDILRRFSQIKIDQLKNTPDKQQYNFEFGTFNKEQKKTLRTTESPSFKKNQDLEEMKLKLNDHYDKYEQEKENKSYEINKKQEQNQQNQKKQILNNNNNINNNNNNNNNKQRIDLIPSLKKKGKLRQQQQNNI
ncbi:unnamed protein product [Paramecium sonneborni]|uniref:Uncharacterized protein n=1 Tax=Paramecium sonneborni TaxID=65129 RepID=A0A8S1NXF1_9CILI|nr:unnamed protein product [Paramecium sonneborni]